MALGNDCPVLAHVLFDPRAEFGTAPGEPIVAVLLGLQGSAWFRRSWCWRRLVPPGSRTMGICARRRLRMPSRAGSPRIAVEEVEKAAGSSHHVDADGRNP